MSENLQGSFKKSISISVYYFSHLKWTDRPIYIRTVVKISRQFRPACTPSSAILIPSWSSPTNIYWPALLSITKMIYDLLTTSLSLSVMNNIVKNLHITEDKIFKRFWNPPIGKGVLQIWEFLSLTSILYHVT